MSELPVVAVISAKPGSEDTVRAAVAELVGPTRQEPGCRSYKLYESAAERGTFVTVESWGESHPTPHMGVVVQ